MANWKELVMSDNGKLLTISMVESTWASKVMGQIL